METGDIIKVQERIEKHLLILRYSGKLYRCEEAAEIYDELCQCYGLLKKLTDEYRNS